MSTTMNPRRSHWIPWTFAGGMLLVLVVNAGMVFAALSTFTGVTVGHSYDRGRTYNHVLEEAARQDALGWRAEVSLEGDALVLRVRNAEGAPLAGQAEGLLRRPLQGAEHVLDLVATAPGAWRASLPALPAGQWEARLRVADGEAHHLDVVRRVVLP